MYRFRHRAVPMLLLADVGLVACEPAAVPGATALRSQWMFGIERMRGDPLP